MEIPVDRRTRQILTFLVAGGLIAVALLTVKTNAQTPAPPNPRAFFDTYCITCHDEEAPHRGTCARHLRRNQAGGQCRNSGEGNRQAARRLDAAAGKCRGPIQPPIARSRPRSKTKSIKAWAAHPNPGRIGAVHRLNRAEYNNAIRDLFALDLDVKPLLPGDDTADGSFDNFADVLSISTAHLERYMSVARQVTRLATGLPPAQPNTRDFRNPAACAARKTGRARICRSARAAASRFTTTFRSTAST